jgi:DNA polymerase III epsilon subunit family exonuclease
MLTLTTVPVPHPVDALFAVRADIKRLKKTEEVLRVLILTDREARVGVSVFAAASDRHKTTVDWQDLARSKSPTDAEIAAFTKTTSYQQVDLEELPSIPALIAALEGPLAVLDTETTGLNPTVDRLISVGILAGAIEGDIFDAGNSGAWTFNPGQPSHPKALAVHGLTEDHLAQFKAFDLFDVIDMTLYCDGATVVIHNAGFDLGFLKAETDRLGVPQVDLKAVVDTRIISKILWPTEKASLDAMAARLSVDVSEREAGIHDSLGDCRILARCLPPLLAKLRERI